MRNALPNLDQLEILEERFVSKGVTYAITEAFEDAVCKYRNAMFLLSDKEELMTLSTRPQIELAVRGVADLEPYLVANCAFRLTLDADGKVTAREPLTIDDVRKWPGRTVKRWFNWIAEVSEIAEKLTQVWVHGRVVEPAEAPACPRWLILGVFISRYTAERACTIKEDFIGPTTVGVAMPPEAGWEGCCFPVVDKEALEKDPSYVPPKVTLFGGARPT